MSVSYSQAETFLQQFKRVILIEVETAKGSTPRDEDAFMLVSDDQFCGTIGGGQLEFLALAHAQKILKGVGNKKLKVALGPELNQCCGGQIGLHFTQINEGEKSSLLARLKKEHDSQPWVYIFGAGHVGQALYCTLLPLPIRVKIIDNRPNLPNLSQNIEPEILALPESAIQTAPKGTSFIILTHDHALDFILTKMALARQDSPYVGMIGSKTKREIFKRDYLAQDGTASQFDRLICPMGKSRKFSLSKMPEVIAAQIANELIDAIL